jgi:hydroxyacid-oxoacid transhydrogenase
MQSAIEFTRSGGITHFLAVGGGSVMDTAKAANLFSNYPKADLYEFINAPIGRGTPIEKKLSPLIASMSCPRPIRGEGRRRVEEEFIADL